MAVQALQKNMNASNKKEKVKAPWKLSLQRFMRNRLALAGAIILLAIVFVTIAAPLFTPYNPTAINIMNTNLAPSAAHPLGTDGSGYDNLARLLYGGRVDLTVAVAAAVMTMLIGVVYGGISGFFGGWIDNLLMRFVDIMLNFPFIPFILALEAIFNTSGVLILITVVSLTAWPGPARFMRGIFLQLREQDYVLGAVTIGASKWRIIFRHMLPNTISSLAVLVSMAVAGYVGLDAGLTFLGLGLPLTVPSWGGMLSQASNYIDMRTEPYLWIPPAAMIILTILSVNFIGDGLRDAFDPQARS
ncbi:MAG: ABC transporter permease [Acidibacillus sp.]|uniref:Oligopeptide transport system permease protein OppC n=1 Tax=Sulfoacidibacillus ferrooxidans TaxID=2005001 RepID=A0A9X1V8F7_9BACL|nr:Oligopeptide transport system permease protein OppC [Sulfoacidibacillus ferrooxidans]MCY0893353.1 ABC transporter permease [Acidibacillus sp.]